MELSLCGEEYLVSCDSGWCNWQDLWILEKKRQPMCLNRVHLQQSHRILNQNTKGNETQFASEYRLRWSLHTESGAKRLLHLFWVSVLFQALCKRKGSNFP